MRPLATCLAAAVLAAAGRAEAAQPAVTLNGVPIDGVTNQKFENCTVVIDEQGTVHIHARGYAVKGAGGDEARPPPGEAGGGGPQPRAAADADRVTRRYFIVTEQGAGGQYDLGIFVNAQWIREVKASEPQAVMEITKYVRPGPNKVTLAATRRMGGERLAPSEEVALRVVIGEGNVGGDHVMIDVPLVETARTGLELDGDRTEEFVIEAR